MPATTRDRDTATVVDTRRATRIAAAVLLPLGPACIAVLRFLLPTFDAAPGREAVAAVAAQPGRQDAVVWLGTAGALLLVPAVLWVGRLTRRQAPVLTACAMALLVPGYVGLAMMIPGDTLLWWGVHEGVPAEQLAVLSTNGHPTVALHLVAFVVGHVVGTVLLGLALLRSGRVPRWAGVAAVVCQPLHFVAFVVLVMPVLDLVAWGLNTAAFAAAGVAILRLTDDEWDLPAQERDASPSDSRVSDVVASRSPRR